MKRELKSILRGFSACNIMFAIIVKILPYGNDLLNFLWEDRTLWLWVKKNTVFLVEFNKYILMVAGY